MNSTGSTDVVGGDGGVSNLKRTRSLDDCTVDDDLSIINNPWITQINKKVKKSTRGRPSTQASLGCSQSTLASLQSQVSVICGDCKEVCSRESCLVCYFCDKCFHPLCCNIKPAIFTSISKHIALLGWSCASCRSDLKSMLQSFRSKASSNGVVIATGSSSPLAHSVDFPPLPSGASTIQPAFPAQSMASHPITQGQSFASVAGHGGLTKGEVVSVVRGTLNEINKRKSNVIISGLREVQGSSDTVLTVEFVKRYFDEAVQPLSTMRLGSASHSTTARKLLVRLATEDAASSLLRAAKQRRSSDVNYAGLNIFINPDLSKDEAKLEYERRVQRRSRLQGSLRNGPVIVNGQVSVDGPVGLNPLPSSSNLRPLASEFSPSIVNTIPVLTNGRTSSLSVTMPSLNSDTSPVMSSVPDSTRNSFVTSDVPTPM